MEIFLELDTVACTKDLTIGEALGMGRQTRSCEVVQLLIMAAIKGLPDKDEIIANMRYVIGLQHVAITS